MATYGDAIKEHARLAVQLYRTRLPEIEQQSGLTLLPDGHCIASTADEVRRYLNAIKAVGGPVAYASAKMVIMNAFSKLGLTPIIL